MKKQPKPLSTKAPPTACDDHSIIEEWITNQTMPSMQPLVKDIDVRIRKSISGLVYAIKWGKAYYGTNELGWVIELAPYHVTVNIVFLKGAKFKSPPPLGTGEDSRYVKLESLDEVKSPDIQKWIEQAGRVSGWK